MRETKAIISKNTMFKELKKLRIADYIFLTGLAILALTIVLPFLNVFAISLSTDKGYRLNPSMLFPSEVTLQGYKALLGGAALWRSFGLTVLYVIAHVLLRLVTSLFAGYALSKKFLPGKRIMTIYLLIPTLFSGGMIPTYLILSELGFIDNFLVFIIPGCVSCYHILLMKTFIRGLEDSIEEAARIDGANILQLLFRVITPMCIPILLTISLLTAVGKWNEWLFGDLYIIEKTYLLPLQNIVMMLQEASQSELQGMDFGSSQAQGFQYAFNMASVVVVTLPIMAVYPFMQKYFEQGLNVGSVKG